MPDTQSTTKPYDRLLAVRRAVSLLDNLTPEDRLKVFSEYCRHCGSDDPKCQCHNDD